METDQLFAFCTLPATPLLLWMSTGWQIGIGLVTLILLLFGSALVSGSEIAYFSLSPNDHERLDKDEYNSSKRVMWLLSQPDKLLATILISNNFINIAIVLLGDMLTRQIIPEADTQVWASNWQARWGMLAGMSTELLATIIYASITVVGVTALLLLFGEVTPKVYAAVNSIRLARFMSLPLSVLMQLFSWPAGFLVSWSNRMEKRLVARQVGSGKTSKQDIDEAIELTVSQEEDSEQDLDILKNIVKFPEVNVRQVMRARVDVIGIPLEATYAEVLDIIRESGYSRYPVYQEEDNNTVTGILYAKDLLMHRNEAGDFAWQKVMRKDVLFVPESKKLNDLLTDFQAQRLHMAVVVDEYGGVVGIATLEDVLEEIIGEIQDEFDDEPEVVYRQINATTFVFEGKTLLNDVSRIAGIDSAIFDALKGEAESLGGLLLEHLGRMPKKEMELSAETFKLKVLQVSARRIEEIMLTLLPPEVDS